MSSIMISTEDRTDYVHVTPNSMGDILLSVLDVQGDYRTGKLHEMWNADDYGYMALWDAMVTRMARICSAGVLAYVDLDGKIQTVHLTSRGWAVLFASLEVDFEGVIPTLIEKYRGCPGDGYQGAHYRTNMVLQAAAHIQTSDR